MSSKFGHHPWTVDDLVSGIDKGTIRLPDIQRPFVWTNAKVRDLIDSMYRGYPVGELMFWENRDLEHSKSIGTGAKTQAAAMQVVDGQQRLTSLYTVVKGIEVYREDYERETIRISFNPLTERFEVPTAVTRKQAVWVDSIVEVFEDPYGSRHKYLKGLREDTEIEVDASVERAVEEALGRLAGLKKYPFQVVQIREEVTRETVADIFVRINSEGVSLSSADFILTWMSVFDEDGRDALETWARNSRFTRSEIHTLFNEKVSWTPHNPYLPFDPGQILRVCVAVGMRRAKLQDAYNVLRGRDPRTRLIKPELRDEELQKLKLGQERAMKPIHWDEFIRVLERAGFRSREMISSTSAVLYSYALWIIGRNDFDIPVDELREIMARWFFMSQITGRYSNSPETKAQEDLNRLEDAKTSDDFSRILNTEIDAAVPDDWWMVTLPNNLITSSSTAPAFLAYIAALNILDAEVLLSTSKIKDWINPQRRPIKGIEKHHLFPRDYLQAELKIKDTRRINQVANYALVEWSDNITISNQEPAIYWPQEVADKNIDDKRRRRQEAWHALPSGWTGLSYGEFLGARRALMAGLIRDGYKRLADPSYKPDFALPAGTVPVDSPKADTQPLPSFEILVLSGVIPPGTLLTPVDSERSNTVAEVSEDGCIKVGEHLCETVERAAREDRAEAGSGWDYWEAHLENEAEPVPLTELRLRALPAAS